MFRPSTALVALLLLAGGCDSLLGFKHATEGGSDGGIGDGGIGDSGTGDSGVTLSTIPGMTSVGPDGVASGAFHILDPRLDGLGTVCAGTGVATLCLAGGLTP